MWTRKVNPVTVRENRASSPRETTNELAKTPTLFGEIRQPSKAYLAIPKTSSERRPYIPMAILEPDIITNTELFMMESASLFHFGVLTSVMHMAWVRQVCGRLKSDYRYSAGLVYNNYPWPENVSEKQRSAVEAAAQKVLAVRAEFLAPGARLCEPQHAATSSSAKKSKRLSAGEVAAGHRPALPTKTSTLADLYDPLATPPALQKAHEELDRAVDKCYRPEPFTSERQRVEFLFVLYEKLAAPLIAATKPKRVARKKGLYAKPPPGPPQPGISPDKAYADAAHFYGIGKEEPPPYGQS